MSEPRWHEWLAGDLRDMGFLVFALAVLALAAKGGFCLLMH